MSDINDEKLRKRHVLKLEPGTQGRNINGTTGLQCRCNSWLRHWKFYSGQGVAFCVVKDCEKRALVGAHIELKPKQTEDFIAPYCASHNSCKKTNFENLDENFPVVSAKPTKLCCNPEKKIKKIMNLIESFTRPS